MKSKLLLPIITVLMCFVFIQCGQKKMNNSTDLFKGMKAKYDGKWFKDYTFKQKTIMYDTVGKAKEPVMWYESVGYPNHFRIDRDTVNHNYVIYRNDSAYYFRKDTLWIERKEPQHHLLFKGGLYFMELSKSIDKMREYGYDLNIFKESSLDGQTAYVVGNDDQQVWIHAEDFYVMRRIFKASNGKKIDVVYSDFKKLDEGWVEQKVVFYVDGKKRMEEFYQDIQYRKEHDPRVYDPVLKYRWYLEY